MSAFLESELARARVMGMKLRAAIEPPTAAKGPFPFPGHRTCDEWEWFDPTDEQILEDAVNGSANLRDAIRRCW